MFLISVSSLSHQPVTNNKDKKKRSRHDGTRWSTGYSNRVTDIRVRSPPPSRLALLTLSPRNSSYKTDPLYQRYYTYAYSAFIGLCVLTAVPYLVRGLRNGYYRTGWQVGEYDAPTMRKEELIVSEQDEDPASASASASATAAALPTPAPPRKYSPHSRLWTTIHACIQSATMPSIPIPTIITVPTLAALVRGGTTQLADCCRKGYIGLTLGQMIIVAAYTAGVIVCSVQGAELTYNANRPGECASLVVAFL